ncbi:MAG: hypothetical protein IJ966_03185 [Bacilli bacterium]|nr:hypothetical protein [Bacilli bacterium]
MKRIIFILTMILFCFCLFSCRYSAGFIEDYELNFTDEEHINNIRPRIEKEYSIQRHEYELIPLYNQNEKLSCFLVNFADGGFSYFKIDFDFKPPKLAPNSLDRLYYHAYLNYIFKTKGWAKVEVIDGASHIEKDEYGNEIRHRDNQFKYSNIDKNQKWYLVEVEVKGDSKNYIEYIPAIKVDGIFIDVVTMEEIKLYLDIATYNEYQITFVGPHKFYI